MNDGSSFELGAESEKISRRETYLQREIDPGLRYEYQAAEIKDEEDKYEKRPIRQLGTDFLINRDAALMAAFMSPSVDELKANISCPLYLPENSAAAVETVMDAIDRIKKMGIRKIVLHDLEPSIVQRVFSNLFPAEAANFTKKIFPYSLNEDNLILEFEKYSVLTELIMVNDLAAHPPATLMEDSHLRHELGRIEKKGLVFKRAEKPDVKQLIDLHEAWLAQKEGELINPMGVNPYFGIGNPNFTSYVVEDQGKLKGWTTVFQKGSFAAIPVRIVLHDQSRPADFMEWNLLNTLYGQGVRRIDRGISISPKGEPFKMKYGAHMEKYATLTLNHL